MKICIPTQPLRQGGGYYFIALLRDYLTGCRMEWTDDPASDYELLFANSWLVYPHVLHRLKRARPGLRVLHRIDGSAVDYGRTDDADHLQMRANLLADATVFQSHYSRHSTREKRKVIPQDGPVVTNPVDLETFRPDGDRVSLPGTTRIGLASFSTNAMKCGWQVGSLAQAHPKATFILCGRFPMVPPLPNVHPMGHLDHPDLARVLRSCDLFCQLSENDPCPNVVIQALACGKPVLYKRSGGVPELVEDAGVALLPDALDLGPALEEVMDRRPELEAAARRLAVERHHPDRVFPRYLEAVERATRRPLPRWTDLVRLAAQGYPALPVPWWRLPGRALRRGAGWARRLLGRGGETG